MAVKSSLYIKQIIKKIRSQPGLSSSQIHELLKPPFALVTTKRYLGGLVNDSVLKKEGSHRSTVYILNPAYILFDPINMEDYFKDEVDDRAILEKYNFNLTNSILPTAQLFSHIELKQLNALQKQYTQNTSTLPPSLYKRELERLAIDLSWKSSQIEGNTYTLLETEQLIKESKEATGKKQEEAFMILNHKASLDFILNNPEYISPLTPFKLNEIHALLIKDLNIESGVRIRGVGITGTNYYPLANDFQINEELQNTCNLVNNAPTVFDKALLLLLLIAYIQPYNDGNKRTSRITSNAILIKEKYCPLSFRTLDPQDYKMAMLMFYEQNSIMAVKEIFINQYHFVVNNYFK